MRRVHVLSSSSDEEKVDDVQIKVENEDSDHDGAKDGENSLHFNDDDEDVISLHETSINEELE